MGDIDEAKKKLMSSLGEELTKEYFKLLKQLLLFSNPITKIQFDQAARKLLVSDEQIRSHNGFILAFYEKITSPRVKGSRISSDKGYFEVADYMDYLPPSPSMPPPDVEHRSAAAELFLPDNGFIASRILVTAWEHDLEGADERVVDILTQACQMFVKNIVTAMLTRKAGYKIRDAKFQHGFSLPVPDPFIRNTHKIIDESQESKIEVAADSDGFIPSYKPSAEAAEQQAAFAYTCGKRKRADNRLTMKLLYDTVKADSRIVGLHSIQGINLIQMACQMEDP